MKLAFAGLLLTACALAEKAPVTIDSLMERSRPADARTPPVWAPDGKHFAYVKDKKVMLYDVPAKTEAELLPLEPLEAAAVKTTASDRFEWQNRRVAESPFQWSQSGQELLLSIGGDVFLWHKSTGKWDQLTATPIAERDAKLSPDGTQVAFRREHDLYVMEVASKKVARLTEDGSASILNAELDWVYPEELDLGTAYWWSPDSKRIAYMQFDISREMSYPQTDLKGTRAVYEPERYPQSGTANALVHLGVTGLDGKKGTRWMDLGDARDALMARVEWLPDSKQIAVQRLNRVQNRLDLLFADAAAGTSRLVLREQDKAWVNVNDDLRFLKSAQQFLWGSERDGFHHLYLYNLDGTLVSRLTQGQWEVNAVDGMDEANKTVFFTSTEVSPLERHLYSVKLDGSNRHKLSTELGTHSISMSPTCDFYLDTFSSLTVPPRKTLHAASGAAWQVYAPSDMRVADKYNLLPTEMVQFRTQEGTELRARLIKPLGFQSGKKYPAIVMVYGGPHAQTVRNMWAGASWDQLLAQRGFVIWQVDNRGSSGRGHVFEAPVNRHLGQIELQDQKEGVRHLVEMGFVDPARIGIYGWSYGGFMTLYSLLHAPDVFHAGIAGAPVTSWKNYDTIYTERYMGLPEENVDGYSSSAPTAAAGNLKAKLLIVHNIEDDNVLFQNTLQMIEALEKADKQFELMLYTQKAHGVTGPSRRHLLETTTEFFEKNLK